MRTVEELLSLPAGAVVHAIHPKYGQEGVVALRTTLFDGEPVWEVTGDEHAHTTAELVAIMGGAEFNQLEPVSHSNHEGESK